jgi:lipopolysaccharide transport system permease protein
MVEYLRDIWAARYFWFHLALSDLRLRWRRSFFGILWSIIQPLGFTALLAVVFSRIFHTDIVEYAPYILSGMIAWEFVTGSATSGATAFIQADAYIRQCRHPLAIYTLRSVISGLAIFLLASTALVGWVLIVMPRNFGWPWVAAVTIYPITAMIAWPLATLLAYIGVRFRDVPHMLGLIFQALWFVSPVYFEAKTFRGGRLDALVDYNPIYHLLEIARAPLLHGQWPTTTNYLFCFGTIAALTLLACAVGYRAERRVILYL